MYVNGSSFSKYKVYAYIRRPRGSSERWHQMTVGLWSTTIFGHSSEFSAIQPAISYGGYTPCWPVIDCKVNDLEWPWVAISCQNPFSASAQHFLPQSVWLSKITAWKVTNIDLCYQRQKCPQITDLRYAAALSEKLPWCILWCVMAMNHIASIHELELKWRSVHDLV